MPAITQFPTVVQQAVDEFGGQFQNEPQRKHFGEYLTGLLVADRKNITGINSEFMRTSDQSCLNRFLTEVDWDVNALNDRRLDWHQKDPTTRYSDRGVIAIDDTLVDHFGKMIEDVGWFWDHAEDRHKIAHDYLISSYVCPNGKHYPLEFRRFRQKELCEAVRADLEKRPGGLAVASEEEKRYVEFKSHTVLFKELVDFAVDRKIPGTFTFDSYFTNAAILNYLKEKELSYVGDLKHNRKLLFKGLELKASELADRISPKDRKAVSAGGRKQWYFTVSVRIPKVNHKVRIVILWKNKTSKEAVKIMVTNRTQWDVTRILRTYRFRWTGTETFHRDGKQHLGMGDCQLRSGLGQTRHLYLVMLAYSLLTNQMGQGRARDWAISKLTTIGEACRAAVRETLASTVDWAIERAISERWSFGKIKAALALD